jgi:hypothetical protein
MSLAVLEWQQCHLDQVQRSMEKYKYSSLATCQKLRDELSSHTNGIEVYEWQVDVSEALLLGLDCTVIAGTGAGKTMPFMMLLFVEPKKVVLIISPLNALEEDQVCRISLGSSANIVQNMIYLCNRQFCDMGLSAVAVNGETYSPELHKVYFCQCHCYWFLLLFSGS